MKLLYCGIITEDDFFTELVETSGAAPFAQQKLERMLVRGLGANMPAGDITILSIPPVPRYPAYPKRIMHKRSGSLFSADTRWIGFVNLPVLKQLTSFLGCLSYVFRWSFKNRREKRIIFQYGTNPINIFSCFINKLLFSIKVVPYVTELDSLRLFRSDTLPQRIKNAVYRGMSGLGSRCFDGFVLIAEAMNGMINKKRKPHLLIEGMVDPDQVGNVENTAASDQMENSESGGKSRVLMYAGTLDRRYGIEKAVAAFRRLDRDDFTFIIYGKGDFKDELESVARQDSRIVYGGIMANDAVVEAEKRAYLLINPRPSDERLTRYSFPSKTLEYMASGTPCLITRLEGIPGEYYQYCYTFDDESIEGMERALDAILSLSPGELRAKAGAAREFVLSQKKYETQCKRLVHFLSDLGG